MDEKNIYTKGMLLPPGLFEFSQNIQGHLTFRIRDVIWLDGNVKKEEVKIKAKFWGEKGRGVILRAENSSLNLKKFPVPTGIKYAIVVPPLNFAEYLEDCLKQKFYILDPRNNKAIGYF